MRNPKQIENLVFEGGGVLGMAYCGALEILEEHDLLRNIKRVAGTSAGALVAMGFSVGHTAAEIKEFIHSTDFRKFEDDWDPLRISTSYGLYKGDFLLEYIRKFMSGKIGDGDHTFEDLHNMGCKDLKVYACCLNTSSIREFSLEKTPTVSVAESVRASMSIPLFFSAWQFSKGIPDDYIYVDGGTVYNYPINAFNNLANTLGFFFNSHEENKVSDLRHNHMLKYADAVFKALLNAQKIDFFKNQEEVDVTVFIDTGGISPTNFKLSEDDKKLLNQSGREATSKYLKNCLLK